MVADQHWDDLLTDVGAPDTYLARAYHEASAVLEPSGTSAVLLRYQDPGGKVVLPLLARPLADGSGWDATSAYGYGGPVAVGQPDVRAFGAALDRWARGNKVVATFLRLHPLLGNAHLVPEHAAELVPAGATVLWDVSPGRDLLAGMHSHHRRAARRAERAGVEVTVDPRPRDLTGFRNLYATTMRRLHAESFFFFGADYWEGLLREADRLTPILVEGRLEGRVVASLLCFASGPWLHYHLGASDDAGRSVGASQKVFFEAATWAQAQGCTGFHLGGGLGGTAESSLFTFKHRYDPGSAPLPFHVAKLVHDQERYRRLAGHDSTSGFFPPWRRSG